MPRRRMGVRMNRHARLMMVVMCACAFAVRASAQEVDSERADDVRQIRHEIERIFQGFIDKDRGVLSETHAENWRGYLAGSRSVIKGRDQYMAAAVGPAPMEPRGQGMVGFRILEYDTVFHGDTAVVSFVAETESRYQQATRIAKLTLMDVYVKQNGKWIQAASQTSLHPDTQAARTAELRTLSDSEKSALLQAREAVWRAWFGGDQDRLQQLLPAELITIEPESAIVASRDRVLQESRAFSAGGGKLTRLVFPRTELQVYGNTAIIYTAYELETDVNGRRQSQSGHATEMFVKRDGAWLNTGWHLTPNQRNANHRQ